MLRDHAQRWETWVAGQVWHAWGLPIGASTSQVHAACAGHSDGLETGAMSDDDSMVLTAAYDKSARVWDLASGKCLAVLASSAQVCPILATPCCDWSCLVGRMRPRPKGRALRKVRYAALQLVSICLAELREQFATDKRAGQCLCWSAFAWTGTLCLGKQRRGALMPSLVQVVKCAISPSSKLAATATQDHSIQIWELPSGRILQDLTVSLLRTHECSMVLRCL